MMCWQEGNDQGGAWHIGAEVEMYSTVGNIAAIAFACLGRDMEIMRNYHSGLIDLVPTAWLRPYPISEIEAP